MKELLLFAAIFSVTGIAYYFWPEEPKELKVEPPLTLWKYSQPFDGPTLAEQWYGRDFADAELPENVSVN